MLAYPQNIKFKYPWRKYQQRVLDELPEHLTDRHLHVVAPPGSGKTVLGLEVAIRINKPTLVLAPTIAIRNQWIQRFCELFLQTTDMPDWISRDIRQPKFLTVTTYQALHAACNNLRMEEEDTPEEEETGGNGNGRSANQDLNTIVNGLKTQHIRTIVVDEAHHLKNEWWQTLTKIKDKLNPVIVGLTATPPYDVSAIEWHRYTQLNGPVDTEISVPELVIEGDLCPHQDYVHFTYPTEEENQHIVIFREKSEKLFQETRWDETIVKILENLAILQDPEAHLEWIYNHISFYSACLIYLNDNQKEIPLANLEIVGDEHLDIPELNDEWLAIFLDYYLFKDIDFFEEFEEHRKTLENRLRRNGIIEGKQISFAHNRRVTGFLTSSISKLNGIKEIVDFEYEQLGSDLRLVVLCDFIRKEFLVNATENDTELNKIGVIPVFEKLRRENGTNKKIGVLTGSTVIIPASAYAIFDAKAARYGITHINTTAIPYDHNYIIIHQTDQLKHHIVHIVTQIFQQGEIEVLVGTKSLLGEGWDAPAVNALVLASFVGSFVSSNQMRGRAIRTQNGNKNKTANIWHLACIDSTSVTGGDDFDLLRRRFRSFVGVSFREDAGIENGVGRLHLPPDIRLRQEAERKNNDMFLLAADRESLKQRWTDALATGVNLVEEIKIPVLKEQEYHKVKSIHLRRTAVNFAGLMGSSVLFYIENVVNGAFRAARYVRSVRDWYWFFAMLGIAGILFFGRRAFQALRFYIAYRDISKHIQHIGEALLNTLVEADVIQTDSAVLRIETSVDFWGAVSCHLEGGTTFEKSVFIHALQEIVAPIENPRYIIVWKSTFKSLMELNDYHAVPEILGRNKQLTVYFRDQWQRLVGDCELVYTRTISGRRMLLQSRMKSLAAQGDDNIEHVNKWR